MTESLGELSMLVENEDLEVICNALEKLGLDGRIEDAEA
jgi:hypothetical protein